MRVKVYLHVFIILAFVLLIYGVYDTWKQMRRMPQSESERNLSRVAGIVGYLEHCVNMKLIFTNLLLTSCHMSTCAQWLPVL